MTLWLFSFKKCREIILKIFSSYRRDSGYIRLLGVPDYKGPWGDHHDSGHHNGSWDHPEADNGSCHHTEADYGSYYHNGTDNGSWQHVWWAHACNDHYLKRQWRNQHHRAASSGNDSGWTGHERKASSRNRFHADDHRCHNKCHRYWQ